MIAQIDRCLSRICVACDVGQRLLGDAEYLIFKGRGERPIGATDVEMNGELLGGELFGETSKTRGESLLGCGRAKIPDAAARFCETLAYVFAGAVNLLAGGGDLRLREKLGGEFELHGHADKALRERVMNLSGYAIAFGEDCLKL